jgi:hypothetical protein
MSNRAATNVVCIKWGDKYPAYYVNRLYQGVSRFLDRPFRFLCFTDDATGIAAPVEVHPLPFEPFEADIVAAMNRPGRKGAWRKISLFRPGLAGMTGQVLGFDLDVAITGPLGDIVDFAPDSVCMRREWRYEWSGRDGGHGSVFCFDPAQHRYLYDEFAADPVGSVDRHKGSEQYYTSMTALRHGKLRYLPGNLICSFKRDSMRLPPFNYLLPPVLPADCRVMCFHGRPKMDEALVGYSDSLLRHSLPAEWLQRYWVGEPA